MELTEQAREHIKYTVSTYNWYVRRLAEAGKERDNEIWLETHRRNRDDYYSELIGMEDLLRYLGFKVEEECTIIERYESMISRLTIDGEIIYEERR